MHAAARTPGPMIIMGETSEASSLSRDRGRARKIDPNALTKQAADKALVRANRARLMKRRTFKRGFTSETDWKNEVKIRSSLANPFRGGRAEIETAPTKKRADV